MSRTGFLTRCLALDKLLVEPLAERHLRPMIRTIGAPHDNIDSFRGLKLLDRIVCLAQVAISSGLHLWDAIDEIIARYNADGTRPAQPLTKLFALSDLRRVAGHHNEEVDRVVAEALEKFGLDPAATAAGWGMTLDQIYDPLSDQLNVIIDTLQRAMRQ